MNYPSMSMEGFTTTTLPCDLKSGQTSCVVEYEVQVQSQNATIAIQAKGSLNFTNECQMIIDHVEDEDSDDKWAIPVEFQTLQEIGYEVREDPVIYNLPYFNVT